MGEAVTAIATLGEAGEQENAASENEAALNLQSQEYQLQYEQKSINNVDIMKRTLDSQEAALSTRGVTMNSPSFNAIQRNTLNIGGKEQRNLDTEEALQQLNISNEMSNVQTKLQGELFGDLGDLSKEFTQMSDSAPELGGGG